MKKFGKIGLALLAAMTMSVTVLAFAACGEKPAVLTGSYHSGTIQFFSAYPGFTYKQLTTSVQSFNTYDNGTYMLVQTSKVNSGDLAFDPENSGDQNIDGVVNRGQSVMIYYGTYTSTAEEGILTVKAAAPTQVVSVGEAVYLNTAAWTDDMGAAAGGDGDALTAEGYLATVAFAEKTFTVDLSTYGFDYLDLSVKAA